MILAWRIDKSNRTESESFSGAGARIYGGRWNRPGLPAVYASDSLALAGLEGFVHLEADGKHIAHVSYQIEIPDSVAIEELRKDNLPGDWRDQPASPSTQTLGEEWLKSHRTAILRVPSVIIPTESNLILNPAHKDFKKLRISNRTPFSFDPRLWKSK